MIRYWFVSITVLITLCCCFCGERKSDERKTAPIQTIDRFAERFININKIADLKRLTDEKRDHMPFFNQSGNRVYFERYHKITPAIRDTGLTELTENYLSIDYKTGQLYLLEDAPQVPKTPFITPATLPSFSPEITMFGLNNNDDLYIATIDPDNRDLRKIYKITEDSLVQLTYGRNSSYLQTISPDGHYMAFLYNKIPTNLVVYDNFTDSYYLVPKPPEDSLRFDLAPQFSPDSKYIAFVRSGDGYSPEMRHYGDIWLIEFNGE